MKKIESFEQFANRVTESLINVNDDMDFEIDALQDKMCQLPECERVDNGYIEIKTPFELNPGSRNPEWLNKVGMIFYPELLSYADQTTPWIACRIEVEGKPEESMVGDLLKYLIGLLETSGYKPFMDEDSAWNHWKKDERADWTNYKCYVNPSYPDGYWENHCLE